MLSCTKTDGYGVQENLADLSHSKNNVLLETGHRLYKVFNKRQNLKQKTMAENKKKNGKTFLPYQLIDFTVWQI